MAKHRAFWHVYLSDNKAVWFSIVMDQLNALVSSRLCNVLDSLHITVVYPGNNVVDRRDLDSFKILVEQHVGFSPEYCLVWSRYRDDKALRVALDNGLEIKSEKITLLRMFDTAWEDEENTKYLYFHTKGVTKDPASCSIETSQNYYYWRKYLNYSVIEQWQKCANLLDKYDSVGPGLYDDPETHYSGGHWWANARIIKDLPDPSSIGWIDDLRKKTKSDWLKNAPARFFDEMWIGLHKHLNSHFGVSPIPQRANPPVQPHFGESYRNTHR